MWRAGQVGALRSRADSEPTVPLSTRDTLYRLPHLQASILLSVKWVEYSVLEIKRCHSYETELRMFLPVCMPGMLQVPLKC